MTFSILAHDPDSHAMGGAAATGSLCVGGWVLRGDARFGMSASQGMSPSTLWGQDVLDAMGRGLDAKSAVEQITSADAGRSQRQLAALDLSGGTGAFSGADNLPAISHQTFHKGVAAGNMLTKSEVTAAMVSAFQTSAGNFAERLLSSLAAAEAAGGDTRGLLSAALLIVSRDHAPITLRIDYHPGDPISALRALHKQATSGDYARWSQQVPNLNDPERGCD